MSQAQSDTAHRNALKTGYELLWYQIKAVLGQGAFGITYLARDINLNRMVAIKEFLPGQYAMRDGEETVRALSEELQERFQWGLQRFIEEGRILDQFDHSNIVRVLNTFEANNTAYMVMRYEQGVSLKEILIRQKFLDESDLQNILFPILDGLEMMHNAGYIHRDIKPSNIFVRTDGTPVLLDFGSARQSMQVETQTLTSLVSPGYAPIEQYVSKSDKQGPWTDIYGMAATLYRAVTGVAPADAISRGEALTGNEKDTYIPCRELADQRYSDQFVEGIDQGLRFLTRERPQTVQAWEEILRGTHADQTSSEKSSGQISNEVVSVVRDSLTQTATKIYGDSSADLDVEGLGPISPNLQTDLNTDTVSIDVAHKQGFHRGLKLVLGILVLLAGGFLVTNFDKVGDVEQQGFIADPDENLSLMPAVEGEAIEPRVGVDDPEQQVEVIVPEPVVVPETDSSEPTSQPPQQAESQPVPTVAEQALEADSEELVSETSENTEAVQEDEQDPLYPESQGQLLEKPETDQIVVEQSEVTEQLENLPTELESVPEATVVSELPPGAVLIEDPVPSIPDPQPTVKTSEPAPDTVPEPEEPSNEFEVPAKQVYVAPDEEPTVSRTDSSDQTVVEAPVESASEQPKTIDDKTSTVTQEGVLIEEYDIPRRPPKPMTLRERFDELIDIISSTGEPSDSETNEEIRERLGEKPPEP